MTIQKTQYPECDKISKHRKEMQLIGEFIDFLKNSKGVQFFQHLSRLPSGTVIDPIYVKIGSVPYNLNTEKVLADFFEIDLYVAEQEKRKMLENINK